MSYTGIKEIDNIIDDYKTSIILKKHILAKCICRLKNYGFWEKYFNNNEKEITLYGDEYYEENDYFADWVLEGYWNIPYTESGKIDV